ncbi:HesA/MoeB/ThiF family protein [Thalassotalea mangrovi]|uniref:HesA/MoeB/ThiF family protein n=2 Tax=Thalassotalea mangrovi TaxID=2572245 RepID=A0A4U1B481_9GAMM|nr:HesA/MoeB/ThiF family protein [Thalassotalea mangrovi]
MLDQVGEQGQLILKNSHIIIVGVGGLGCAAAQYLAASGIGHLSLIDHDSIERSNLHRQILFKVNHLGKNKAQIAANQLLAANPDIVIDAIDQSVLNVNLVPLLASKPMILDCTDNSDARYYINRICVQYGLQLVSAAAINGQGHLLSFDLSSADSPCYACLYPEPVNLPQNCQTAGVLGPVLGVMGSLQATEAIRLLLGKTEHLGKLTLFDAWQMSFNEFRVNKSEQCRVCCR